MKISLSMMLKNEGKTVFEVIARVLPVVDEVVVGIDEATTDNTKTQVKKAVRGSGVALKIINFKFNNNFSEIRNNLLEHCTGDYVLILDGHDLMTEQSVEFFKVLKQENKFNLDIYDFNVVQRHPNGKETWFQQPRLFKPHIRYDFSIHNTIIQTERRATVPQIVIFHEQPVQQYEARKEQRAEINIDKLIEESNKAGSRSKFYIAQTLFEQERFEEAAQWYRDYIQESSFIAERYQARLYLAKCYEKMGRKDDAIKTLKSCFIDDEPRNEHLIALGDIYFEEQNYQMALYYYKLAETVSMPVIFLMIEKEFYTWLPNFKQLQVYLALNDIDNSLRQCDLGEQKAPELETWREVRRKIENKIKELKLNKRGLIYFVSSNIHFLLPIIQHMKKSYSVRFDNKFNPEHAKNADVIWCDWADYNAVAVARYETKARKVLRVHSYEAYSHFVNSFNINAFDKVIFVAKHTAHFLFNRLSLFGDTSIKDKMVIIPNGVDMNNFYFTSPGQKKRTNKIAFAGNLKCGKGVQLLIMLAKELPEYEFHVAGRFYELDLQEYYYKNIPGNVRTYAWQEDLDSFFADKTYILSCSVRESNHLTVMEGMAAGLMPLVHSWVGAREIFPPQFVWSSISELKEILENEEYDPMSYRIYVNEKYSLLKMLSEVGDLIKGLMDARN